MRQLFCFLFCLWLALQKGFCQVSSEKSQQFHYFEDTISAYLDTIENGVDPDNQLTACYRTIRTLKTALKIEHSYDYPFDSIPGMSIIKALDNTFRIFTWQLELPNQTFRYFGAIQLNRDTLALFPLVDYSDFYENPEMAVVGADRWIGAYYYNMAKTKSGKNTYYTVFGLDGNNAMSTKKVADVLWFRDGEPRFGAPIFELEKDKPQMRFFLEYKKEAAISLNYNVEEKRIIYDHLTPMDDNSEGFFFNYVPDGTYEGFKWKKGLWRYIETIEYQKLEDGQAPNFYPKDKPSNKLMPPQQPH